MQRIARDICGGLQLLSIYRVHLQVQISRRWVALMRHGA